MTELATRVQMTMTQFKPHDYQWKAIEFALEHDHCGLFLPMGAGKTVTTLTIIEELLLLGYVSKVLIIGPVRVIQSTWPDEIAKWEHTQDMTYRVVTGTQKQRIQALGEDSDIYLIGKENVKWLIDSRLFDFDMVVIDELSTFKNPRSQRFKALKTEMPKVDRFIGLTGTPAPKGIPDLWSQIYLMDRGERLGKTLTAFRQRYLKPGRRNGYIVYNWLLQEDAEERIYAKLSDICMSLKAEDCAELPPVQYLDYKVELTPKVKAKYRAFKREKVLSVQDDNILAANAGVLCQMLLQMTSGEIYVKDDSGKNVRTDILHDEKLKALDDLIESANGQAYHHIDETLNKEAYDMEQKQRSLERKLREWDRKEKILNAGGVDSTEAKRWKSYYKKKLDEHVKSSHGFLKRDYAAEKALAKGKTSKSSSASDYTSHYSAKGAKGSEVSKGPKESKLSKLLGLITREVKRGALKGTEFGNMQEMDEYVAKTLAQMFKGYNPAELVDGGESQSGFLERTDLPGVYTIKRTIVNAAHPEGDSHVNLNNPALANSIHERGHDLLFQLAIKRCGYKEGQVIMDTDAFRITQEVFNIEQQFYLAGFTDESTEEILDTIEKKISTRARTQSELLSEALVDFLGKEEDNELANVIVNTFKKEWDK